MLPPRSTLWSLPVSLGLLLVMTSAFPTPGPLGEDFKNDTTPGRLLLTTPEKTEALIKRMVDKISAMRKEVGRLAPGWWAPMWASISLLLDVNGGFCIGRSLLGLEAVQTWSQRGRLCPVISPLLLVSDGSFSSWKIYSDAGIPAPWPILSSILGMSCGSHCLSGFPFP